MKIFTEFIHSLHKKTLEWKYGDNNKLRNLINFN